MAYEKQSWEDYPSTNTPITSDRLSHIEQGIYDNSIDIVSTASQLRNEMKTNLITQQVTETKETIDGEKVYVKVINIGTLPNATRKIVSTGLDGGINVIDLKGMAKGSDITIPLPFVYPELANCISLMFVDGDIYINTGSNRTNLTGTVEIYYTINNNGANTGGAN